MTFCEYRPDGVSSVAGAAPRGYTLLYFVDGSGRLCAEGLSVSVGPGELAILPSDLAFKVKTRQDSLRGYHTVLHPCGMPDIDKLLSARSPKVFIGLKRRWFFEVIKSRLGSDHAYGRRAAFHNLVALIYEINTPHPELAQEIPAIESTLREIQGRLNEPVLDVGALARQAGLDGSYFIRLFKSRLGVPPLQYFLRLKIETAQPLLRETELPIHAIARDLGFSDPFHFSRTFKRFTGRSPSHYREKGLEKSGLGGRRLA